MPRVILSACRCSLAAVTSGGTVTRASFPLWTEASAGDGGEGTDGGPTGVPSDDALSPASTGPSADPLTATGEWVANIQPRNAVPASQIAISADLRLTRAVAQISVNLCI